MLWLIFTGWTLLGFVVNMVVSMKCIDKAHENNVQTSIEMIEEIQEEVPKRYNAFAAVLYLLWGSFVWPVTVCDLLVLFKDAEKIDKERNAWN